MDPKKKKRAIIVVVILLIPVIAAGAIYATLEEPGVELVDMELKDVSFSDWTITLLLTVEVDNPNIVGFRLTRVELDVSLDGSDLGYVSQNMDERIAGSGCWLVARVVKRPGTALPGGDSGKETRPSRKEPLA